MAVDFKILLQRRAVALPNDRRLVSEVHSIKRTVLPSGKVSFDSNDRLKMAMRTGFGRWSWLASKDGANRPVEWWR